MEFRKIISFGKASYIVSLPKAWIEKNNLQKGDVIVLEEENNMIKLKMQGQAVPALPKKKVIQANNKDIKRIQTEIITAYLASYEIIKVIGKDLKTKGNDIKEIFHNLTGMEVLERDSAKIIAKDILNPREISVPLLMRRIDNMVRTMFLQTIQGEDALALTQRDKDINRIAYLLNRLINGALDNTNLLQNIGMNHREMKKNLRITNYMEGIGNCLKRVARNNERTKLAKKDKSKIVAVLSMLHQEYLQVMKSFHTGNVDLAYDIEMRYKDKMEECKKLHALVKDIPSVKVLYNLKSICSTIKNIGRAIAIHERVE